MHEYEICTHFMAVTARKIQEAVISTGLTLAGLPAEHYHTQ